VSCRGAAPLVNMNKIIRNADTGQPGNPGSFGTHNHTEDVIALSDAYDRVMEQGGVADLSPESVAGLSDAGKCSIYGHNFPDNQFFDHVPEFPECLRCGIDEAAFDAKSEEFWEEDEYDFDDDIEVVVVNGVVIAQTRHIDL
jgi:hypothetical protein